MNMESLHEYGSRVGAWRPFAERGLAFTSFAVGMAIERHPEPAQAMAEAGHEIASHGRRWIDYQHVEAERERADLRRAIAAHRAVTGGRPLGRHLGRCSPNTARLVAEEGGFPLRLGSLRRRAAVPGPPARGVARRGAARQRVVPTRSTPTTCGRHPGRVRERRGLPRLPARQLRLALFGGRGRAAHALGRAALPAGRAARTCHGASPLPRSRAAARPGLDLSPHRHRPALARASRRRRGACSRLWREPCVKTTRSGDG